jgi:hypothetical protein
MFIKHVIIDESWKSRYNRYMVEPTPLKALHTPLQTRYTSAIPVTFLKMNDLWLSGSGKIDPSIKPLRQSGVCIAENEMNRMAFSFERLSLTLPSRWARVCCRPMAWNGGRSFRFNVSMHAEIIEWLHRPLAAGHFHLNDSSSSAVVSLWRGRPLPPRHEPPSSGLPRLAPFFAYPAALRAPAGA